MKCINLTWQLLTALAIVVASAQFAKAELVHLYTFDDGTANDSVGDLHGTIEGGPDFVSGVSGAVVDKAILLNPDGGNTQSILFPENEFGDQFTIATWVQPGSTMQASSAITLAASSGGGFAVDGFRWFVNAWNSDPPDGSLRFETGDGANGTGGASAGGVIAQDEEWHFVAITVDKGAAIQQAYHDGLNVTGDSGMRIFSDNQVWRIGSFTTPQSAWIGAIDEFAIFDSVLDDDAIFDLFENGITPVDPLVLLGGGQTYVQDFDEMGLGTRLPRGWTGVTEEGVVGRAVGLGLTDGFLTVPGSDDDGVLGVLNLGGNEGNFGPAPGGFIPTWTAELAGANNLFGQDDAEADNASDRALGVSRENNSHVGQLNFEIEIADANLRAFVLDWDLEIWGGDPDGDFRSPEGPGMAVDVTVGATSYATMTANLLPGAKFDSLEDGSGSDHNATLIDGNVHSVRGMSSGIKEVSSADGAVGNMVQINFNSNWNGTDNGDANGWISAIDNVQLRALAPGDADANGVVDVADLLQLLGGQKFNQGVDGVTWEQGDFNADDQFNTGDLLAMLSFLSGTFPSDPYASEAGGASDAVADLIVNSETGEVTVDLAGHIVSVVIIESASEIFNGSQPEWDTTSQFPSTLPGELGNVLFTSTASGTDELGAVISAEFLGRDKEFYLQDLDLNILIASEGGALTKGNVIVVPEPSAWLMLGLGSLLLVGWRQGATRRRPGM